MTAPTPPRRGDDVVAALADAFDAVAPHDRAAAEQELLDAGLDPRTVARRSAALATEPGTRRAPERSVPVAASRRRWRGWAIAAGLALIASGALLAGRQRPDRLVRSAPAPRTIEPPSARVAAPQGGEQPDRAAAQAAEPDARSARRQRAGRAPGAGSVSTVDVSTDMLALVPEPMGPLIRSGAVGIREVEVDPNAIAALHSPAFVEASTANAGNYEIAPSCRLRLRRSDIPVRERFGYPFPNVSPEAGTAGCEIVWNAEAAFAAGGGRRGRVTACGVASTHSEGGEEPQSQCWDGHFTALAFVGRLSGPIRNPSALRSASLLSISGLNGTGAALLAQRPIGDEQAKHFRFEGRTRRVRSHAALDPPVLDDRLRLSADDFNCFDASPELYEWRVLGRQDVLAPLSGQGVRLSSEPGAATDQGATLTAMRRNAWVVEGKDSARRRVVLFIDSELYRPYWKVEYEGRDLIATYACGAGWTSAGEEIVPLTSAVTRFDRRGGRIDRLTPGDEVIDPNLGDEEVTLSGIGWLSD